MQLLILLREGTYEKNKKRQVPEHFTDQNPTSGSDQEVLQFPQVESGRVGSEDFGNVTGRVGSVRFWLSRAAPGQPGQTGPTRRDLTREKPRYLSLFLRTNHVCIKLFISSPVIHTRLDTAMLLLFSAKKRNISTPTV